MIVRRSNHTKRRGATAVETAAVIAIALLFVFGLIEYARYLFFLQAADNAVREAARYASAHTNDGTVIGNLTDTPVFDSTDTNYPGQFKFGSAGTSIRAVVNYTLGNAKTSITSGYDVQVYNANPATAASLGGNWYDSPFAGAIVVELKGTYSFFLPSFLHFSGSSIAVDIKAMTTSEAN
jgi:Flp pilus assembly protein TadG